MRGYVRIILAVMLAAAAAVGSARGEEAWKKYNDGTITWLYQMVDGNSCRIKPASYRFGAPTLTIPSGVMGIRVVEVASRAFDGCRTLTSVVIPEGVTTIWDGAFEDCVNLSEVSLPSSVTKIGAWAFARFTRLTSVMIPSSVTTIEIGAFAGCSGLASVTISEGVTTIGDGAFSDCSGLTSVAIPSSVTMIASVAFADCSGLQRIEVEPRNPRYQDEDGVLFGTEHDPKSGKEVKALICCPAGRAGEYRIPGEVEMIDANAFSRCSKLTSVTIPEGVTKIDGNAFGGCSGLTSVTIPSSVITIGSGAFAKCSGLQRIEVASGNLRCHAEEGVLFGTEQDLKSGKEVKALIWYPMGRAGEYKLPDDVEVVEWGAFSGCSKLTKVTFPGRIELLNFNLFDDCIALEEIVVEFDEKGKYYTKDGVLFSMYSINGGTRERTYETTLVRCPRGKRGAYEIPTGVEVIGEGAFAGCSQLTDIAIPTGVRYISPGAFSACGGLTRVVLPATVSYVSEFSLNGCSRLEEFAVDAASPYYRAEGGALLSRDGRMLLCYPEGRKGAYEIPQGVTDLGDGAGFSFSHNLTSLVVPSSLKEISGIDGCENLKEVYWLASADISDGDDGFYDLPLGATLYVRPGEKPKVEAKEWAKRFSKIIEGHVVTFRDADGQPVGEQLVKPNGKAHALDMQDKDGNAVVWLLNGAPYDFNAPVRGDLVLQAGGSSTAVESALLAGVQAVSNPVVDVLELRGMGNAARVEVYSVAGVQVHAGALRGEERVQVDARGWASGVYVVRVVARDGAKTLRVVKRD